MLALLALALGATPIDPVVRLRWSDACPSKRALSSALRAYGIETAERARVTVEGDATRLRLLADGALMTREVSLPPACADRAAVIAVVIEALVAPYFWPARPRPASAPTASPSAAPSAVGAASPMEVSVANSSGVDGRAANATGPRRHAVSALDLLGPTSSPASNPASLALASPPSAATLPASAPATAAAPTAFAPAASMPSRRALPMSVMLLGAVDAWDPVRGRVGLAYTVTLPQRVRWWLEASYLTARRIARDPGALTYWEGEALAGADVTLLAGWFAGVGLGLQLLSASASGFDANRSATLLGPTFTLRTGYRHVFWEHFELGAHLLARLDAFAQRLLVDDSVVTTLPFLHVGAAATIAWVF